MAQSFCELVNFRETIGVSAMLDVFEVKKEIRVIVGNEASFDRWSEPRKR
jgi:hypothetical protein